MSDVDKHGPFFDQRRHVYIEHMCQSIQNEVAEAAEGELRGYLLSRFQRETGYYRSHLTTVERPGRTVVTDQGVIYGPWLEGTGSRNRTTRFKGYFGFRLTTKLVDAKKHFIAQPIVDAWVERLNNG